MEHTPSENPSTILFCELLNFFRSKDKISKTSPLPLKRYFYLLSLTDKELKQLVPTQPKVFVQYKKIQQLLIGQFEKQLQPDMDDLARENIQILQKINSTLIRLEKNISNTDELELISKMEIDISSILKNNPHNLYNIAESFIENFLSCLQKLSSFTDPAYSKAKTIIEIEQLRQSLPDEVPIQIQLSKNALEDYHSIVKRENEQQKLFYSIYEEIIALQYVLSPCINDEIIFNLAFIDNHLLFDYAPKLAIIYKKRTALYVRIAKNVSNQSDDISTLNFQLEKVSFDPKTQKHVVWPNDLLYYRLRTIIRYYLINPLKTNTLKSISQAITLPLTDKLEFHIRSIFSISSETLLFDKEFPANYNSKATSNLQFFQKLLGFTSKDLSSLLGVHESTLSRSKDKKTLALLAKLALFCNFSRNFFLEETTLPCYEKQISINSIGSDENTSSSKIESSYYKQLIVLPKVTAGRLLSAFQDYLAEINTSKTILKQNLRRTLNDEKLHNLFLLITAIRENINTIDVDDINAIKRLLRLNSPKT
jgi:hypothetical protein